MILKKQRMKRKTTKNKKIVCEVLDFSIASEIIFFYLWENYKKEFAFFHLSGNILLD